MGDASLGNSMCTERVMIKLAKMPSPSKIAVEDDPGGAGKVKRTGTTVTLEDDLIRKAQAYTGIKKNRC